MTDEEFRILCALLMTLIFGTMMWAIISLVIEQI
jgi:hypothetical protein